MRGWRGNNIWNHNRINFKKECSNVATVFFCITKGLFQMKNNVKQGNSATVRILQKQLEFPLRLYPDTIQEVQCDYSRAAESPVRCGESHLSVLIEPPSLRAGKSVTNPNRTL